MEHKKDFKRNLVLALTMNPWKERRGKTLLMLIKNDSDPDSIDGFRAVNIPRVYV